MPFLVPMSFIKRLCSASYFVLPPLLRIMRPGIVLNAEARLTVKRPWVATSIAVSDAACCRFPQHKVHF